ncbi:MAG TPA: M23 family metallopeptidase [Spirochaetales bacterium]|nr:M23 family metallopeptidase [Spirochaetales bacterium]
MKELMNKLPKGFIRFFLCLLCLSVASVVLPVAVSAQEKDQAPTLTSSPFFIQMPDKLAQGDPFVAWIWSAMPLNQGTASLTSPSTSKTITSGKFFYMPGDGPGSLYGVLLPIPNQTEPGTKQVLFDWDLNTDNGVQHVHTEKSLVIGSTEFLHESIPLDKANTLLETQEDPAKTAESLSFAKIFGVRDPLALYAGKTMTRPLTGEWRQTAGFGDIRLYKYYNGGTGTSVHGGIDLGVKTGTPVHACFAGNVVFAGMRIVTGNTIVLEHLPGLFSIYMHLSKITVTEGEKVDQGEAIGLSGSTGLSTGPHLHWEVRIGDVSVNPYYFLEHNLIDKEVISSNINALIEGR